MDESSYSPGLVSLMVWLSGQLPYQAAAEVLARAGRQMVSESSIWRRTQAHGTRLQSYVDQQQVPVLTGGLAIGLTDHKQQQGVSMDGGMVNVRGEGWKEFKVGVIYDVEPCERFDPMTQEPVDRVQAQHMRYTAVLGTVDEFRPAIWTLAWQRGILNAGNSSVTADGADWIWNLTGDLFPDSIQIVDWYHACENLAKASHALHPEAPEKAARWFKAQRTQLWLGHAQVIAHQLDQADLPQKSGYFHKHHRRMQYQECRDRGYPTGSGSVESGIKRFKARLTGAGMRWLRSSAEQMLVIREAVLSNTFDELWAAA
jgi:hypothetical protein